MESAKEIVHHVRSLRSNYSIPASKKTPLAVNFTNEEELKRMQDLSDAILTLSFSSSIDLVLNQEAPAGSAIDVVNPNCQIFLAIKEFVNVDQELKQLSGKQTNFNKQLEALRKKMGMAEYEQKVPENVRTMNAEKEQGLIDQIALTEGAIERFKQLQ